ncbi:MAG: hypothetical protein IT440_00645 [Phycisphaeraceae bacterium]|nr:hypothetical protein [Phycisphaeraceae bacterium]
MNEPNIRSCIEAGELAMVPLRINAEGFASSGTITIAPLYDGEGMAYRVVPVADATPRGLRIAIAQQRGTEGPNPVLVAPFLGTDKLNLLIEQRISGIDLCGNGVVFIGKSILYRSGEPNRYPEGRGIRSTYRGDSSLVARALLLQPEFQAVGEVLEAIKQRGGSLTMGTVSKVLKRLESDLVIERPSTRAVRLIQPERLLDQLLGAYQVPKVESTWLGKVALSDADLQPRLEKIGAEGGVVRTGDASAAAYAAYAGEPMITCYCRASPAKLLEQLGAEAKETRAFPNLRLAQTDDQRVYFDRRPKLVASPIQSWLEMAGGDKRQKEAAEQIRGLLLESIRANS